MRSRSAWLLLAHAALWLSGCASEPYLVGLDEPIVAHNAELKHGALPGAPADSDDDLGVGITSLELRFGVMKPGAPNLTVAGRATGDAYAVAIRIVEQGSGYWLKPVGIEDPTLPGELTFEFSFDAASEIVAGRNTFAAVAFDKDGRAGKQYTIPICIGSDVPDNGNACNPRKAPPLTVASLSWNADADVDLIVVGPDGTRYDRTNRILMQGEQVSGLDADGVTGCLLDGRRRENFVWNEDPGSGTWLVYTNLFDACGKTAVEYTLTVYRAQRNDDGTFAQVATSTTHGSFLRAQANGGAGDALYLLPISF